jgi:hypothetical protein
MCSSVSLCPVCLGWLHSRACLAMSSDGLPSVWPSHPHLRFLICKYILGCFVRFHNSLFVIYSAVYDSATLFALLQSYTFQPSRAHPQGEFDTFCVLGQQNASPFQYQIKDYRVIPFMYVTYNTLVLKLICSYDHVLCWPCSQNISVLPWGWTQEGWNK